MKIIVDDLAVEYQDEGRGPAKAALSGSSDSGTESRVLLFLHGWKDDLHTFNALVPMFSSKFRIVRVDFPGFGGSELPKVPWLTGDYVRLIESFCKKIEIIPEVVVGHSFGGRVIIKGVCEGIFNPKRVVLIASAGFAKYKTFHARFFLFAAKTGKLLFFFLPQRLQDRFRRKLYGAAGSGDYMNIHSGVLKETFLKAIREDLSHCAQKVGIPTLLIWGERDVVTPIWDGKRLHSLISGSRLEVIKGAGHFVHQEQSEKVADLIKRFVL